MLTLKQFKSLADSYGAQLWRWPEDSRSDATALLSSSAEARQILDRARRLDDAIGAARVKPPPQDIAEAADAAALARLRAAVAARLDVVPIPGRFGGLFARLRSFSDGALTGSGGWVGFASASAVAIVAGVIVGLVYAPAPAPHDLLASLYPAPIQIFSEH